VLLLCSFDNAPLAEFLADAQIRRATNRPGRGATERENQGQCDGDNIALESIQLKAILISSLKAF
jgi:hypothetical protein